MQAMAPGSRAVPQAGHSVGGAAVPAAVFVSPEGVTPTSGPLGGRGGGAGGGGAAALAADRGCAGRGGRRRGGRGRGRGGRGERLLAGGAAELLARRAVGQ